MNNLTDQFVIRQIEASDKEALQEGLTLLSNESRRQRFFSSRKEFTENELKFFTEVDQKNHLALVAINNIHGPSPAGTIRCIRDTSPGREYFAELAITIIDSFQGKGLGFVLLELLAQAALKQNITHFYGDLHSSNTKMLKLLEKHCVKNHIPNQSFLLKRKSDGFLYFEMPLS